MSSQIADNEEPLHPTSSPASATHVDSTISDLSGRVHSVFAELENLHASLREQSDGIAENEGRLGLRAAELDKREEALTEQSALIVGAEAELRRRETELNNSNAVFAKSEAGLAERSAALEALAAELEVYETDLRTREETVRGFEEMLEQLQVKVAAKKVGATSAAAAPPSPPKTKAAEIEPVIESAREIAAVDTSDLSKDELATYESRCNLSDKPRTEIVDFIRAERTVRSKRSWH